MNVMKRSKFIISVNSLYVIFEIIAATFRISFLEHLLITVSLTEPPLILSWKMLIDDQTYFKKLTV